MKIWLSLLVLFLVVISAPAQDPASECGEKTAALEIELRLIKDAYRDLQHDSVEASRMRKVLEEVKVLVDDSNDPNDLTIKLLVDVALNP